MGQMQHMPRKAQDFPPAQEKAKPHRGGSMLMVRALRRASTRVALSQRVIAVDPCEAKASDLNFDHLANP